MNNLSEISQFNSDYRNNFQFKLSEEHLKTLTSSCILELKKYETAEANDLIIVIEAIRILSRDGSNEMRENLCNETLWINLITISGLSEYASQKEDIVCIPKENSKLVEEALKAMCNLTKNFSSTIPLELSKIAVKGGIKRMELYESQFSEVTHGIKIFETKFLFILTALFSDLRIFAVDPCGVLSVMKEVFQSQMKGPATISPSEVEVDIELLKLLFNCLYHIDTPDVNESTMSQLKKLVTVLRDLQIAASNCRELPEELKKEMLSNFVNLLTSLPAWSFYELIVPLDEVVETSGATNGEPRKEGHLYESESAMRLLELIMELLRSRIYETTIIMDHVAPVMHGLAKAAQADRNIRKYYRLQILPYMKQEVLLLPEQGDTIRNKLCQLLQHHCEEISESVAFLLFVLCKQSVDRAIKYTGFGNFSGFLARHSLLGEAMRSSSCDSHQEGLSSDSETEEYERVRAEVNPVTGRVEAQRPDPLAGMSEEQKEYEVVRLMDQIDKLQRQGLIQPGVMTEDGGVRPAESVLEVVERAATNSLRTGAIPNDEDVEE